MERMEKRLSLKKTRHSNTIKSSIEMLESRLAASKFYTINGLIVIHQPRTMWLPMQVSIRLQTSFRTSSDESDYKIVL